MSSDGWEGRTKRLRDQKTKSRSEVETARGAAEGKPKDEEASG